MTGTNLGPRADSALSSARRLADHTLRVPQAHRSSPGNAVRSLGDAKEN